MRALFKSLQAPQLAQEILAGKVGVLPTDTVYGLVCRAQDQAAVGRLYSLKQRQNKAGTVIAASIDQLVELGIKRSYLKAVEQFWPGAVSVVIPFSDPTGTYLRQGNYDLAVRIPNNVQLQQLLSATGALLTSSANPTGLPPANNIEQAKAYFGDKIDFYVDGGDMAGKLPSTVIKIIDDAVEVLRPGAVEIKDNGVAK